MKWGWYWTTGTSASRHFSFRKPCLSASVLALELLRHGAYCKRKRRLVRAHHGGAWRREHVRGRGATIVGTSGERRFAVGGVGKRADKSSQAEGQW